MTIRLGIIGAGGISAFHAAAAARSGFEVAVFCDIDDGRARRAAEQHPGARATDSLEAVLDDDGIDAIAVCTPNHLHHPVAVAALEAGKDVLLEKPMALSVDECDKVVEARDRSGRILQVGFVSRGAPTSVLARDLVTGGRLGRVYHVKASMYRRRGIPGLGGWFTTRARSGGGVLVDLGVHLVDLALWLTGRPAVTRVSAACTSTFGHPVESYRFTDMWAGPPDPEGLFDVDDAATALIRCGGGLTIELNTTWAANLPASLLPDGVLLLGDRGGCHFDHWANRMTATSEQDGVLYDMVPDLPAGDAWAAAWSRQYERFGASIRDRTPPDASGEDGRAVQAVLDAMQRSSEGGAEVAVGAV